jgi:TolB-like protein/DNA-binding winged helix-turn-helix (wHTH) protein/Tfp pilus assembly protein PilF
MSRVAPRRYRFDAFELDTRTRELHRRGARVRLSGRPIEILIQLLDRPGELVTRDQLRTALWSADTFVDFDHGMNSAMNRLRDALRDPAERSRLIETLPRRGYRFIGEVEVAEDAPASPATNGPADTPVPVAAAGVQTAPSGVATPDSDAQPAVASIPLRFADAPRQPAPFRARWTWTAAMLAATLLAAATWWLTRTPAGADMPRRVMLVVLPFVNFGGGSADDYLADGVTDELISQLGALDPSRLGVIARTTSMQYRGSAKSVMEIAQALDVQYLLEGTVRRDDGKVAITARLIDVDSQTQRWSQTYERALDDLLALQRDIAMQVASSLADGVLEPVLRRTAETASTPFAVYELVLRARAFREQATEQSAWRCVTTFDEALRIEPQYAPAHAGLADCYRLLGAPGWEAGPPAELMGRARAAVAQAMQLDPRQPEAYAVRGMVTFAVAWDLPAAERDLRQAIALNPSFARAHQYLSSILTTQHRFDEAVASARKAVDLDPLSANENTTLGVRLYYAGQYEAAVAQLRRTLARTPDLPVAHWAMAMTYREQGRPGDAIAELQRAVALSGESPYMRAWLAHALAGAGQLEEATAIRRDLERQASQRFVSPFLFALMASGFGERDATLMWLERTADAQSGWVPFLAVEPEFRWIRDDPRFRRIVARVVR